jgi:hypothetical protein
MLRRIAVVLAAVAGLAVAAPLIESTNLSPLPLTAVAYADEHEHQWADITGTSEVPRWAQAGEQPVWKCYSCGTVAKTYNPIDEDDD